MQQLRSDIWCSAFVRRHNDLGHMCVVARRGDPIAGQIWVEVDHLDGTMSLFSPAPTAVMETPPEGKIFHLRYERTDPATIRDRIVREAKFDQDLWVISVDSRTNDIGLDLV